MQSTRSLRVFVAQQQVVPLLAPLAPERLADLQEQLVQLADLQEQLVASAVALESLEQSQR
jgi:hypothetical protein